MLNSPAISELHLELSALTLFNEFLGGYFNAQSHAVGYNTAVLFPRAEIRFQQAAVTASLNGAAISLVWVTPSRIRKDWETVGGVRQQMATADISLLFFVRAQLAETGSGNSNTLAQSVGDLLFALLENSKATQPLSQKGIHHLKAKSPILISNGSGSREGDPKFAMRLLNCNAQLRYAVLSQPTT